MEGSLQNFTFPWLFLFPLMLYTELPSGNCPVGSFETAKGFPLLAAYFFRLFFDSEVGGSTFLQNVSEL
jgi:hypothetical protein